MSDILEKTIASLPNLISGGLSGKPTGNSRAFQAFIKSIGNLKSKYEEEQFIKRELSLQKQKLVQPGISTGQVREYLVRLVYCTMLGYDVSFAYIHAIKLAQQGILLDKRAGYLVTAIFLHDGQELVMLLVNTIQKDLRSSNIADVCMALTAAGKLISQEMIPALLPLVEEKLKHPREIVRKKAVLCMHAFHLKAPGLLAHAHHHLRAALCDRDPGVMWAALHFYYSILKTDPATYVDLVPSLVGLLDQVISRHLPADFDYHSVPAPWLQILLLKMLAKLGQGNQCASQMMYPVLGEVLQRTEPSHKIGLAVIYECLETVLTIWPYPILVEHAAKCVGKFLSSKGNNLKYLGVKALTLVVQINPGFAIEHQEAVIDSLEHPDLTIRTKTLELLYQMANPKNSHVICDRLLHHLTASADNHIKVDLITKVTQLAEKFSEDRQWFIETVNRALVLGGESAVPPGVNHRILAILPEGPGLNEGSRKDTSYRKFAVSTYWTILHQDDVPQALLQVAAWVLGEYCGPAGDIDLNVLTAHLKSVYLRPCSTVTTRTWILSALIKLACHVHMSPEDLDTLRCTLRPQDSDLIQRFSELERITNSEEGERETLKKLRMNTTEEKDWSLSFLDGYVADRLEEGGEPYRSYFVRHPQPQPRTKDGGSLFTGLNFTPYEIPVCRSAGESPAPRGWGSGLMAPGENILEPKSGSSGDVVKTSDSLQVAGVQRVWERTGVVKPEVWKLAPPSSANKENQDHREDQEAMDELPSVEDGGREAVQTKQQLALQLFSGITPPPKTSHDSSQTQGLDPVPFSRPKELWTTDDQPIQQETGEISARNDAQPELATTGRPEISHHPIIPLEQLRNDKADQIWSKDMLSSEELASKGLGETVDVVEGKLFEDDSQGEEELPAHDEASSSSSSESQASAHTGCATESMFCEEDSRSFSKSPASPDSQINPETSGGVSGFEGIDMAEYVDVTRNGRDVEEVTEESAEDGAIDCMTIATPDGAAVSLLSAADITSPVEPHLRSLGEDLQGDSGDFVKVDLIDPSVPGHTLNPTEGDVSSCVDVQGNIQVPNLNQAMLDDSPLSDEETTHENNNIGNPSFPVEESGNMSVESSDEINKGSLEAGAEESPSGQLALGVDVRQDDELSVDSLEREKTDQEDDLTLELSDLELDLLPNYLHKYPHEMTSEIVGSNNTLIVLSQKAWLPDRLVVVVAGVFTGLPIGGAEGRTELKIEVDTDDALERGLAVVVTSTTIDQSEESVLPTGCCFLVLDVTCDTSAHTDDVKAALAGCAEGLSLRLLRRSDSGTALEGALQIHLPLAVTDFLRPVALSAKEFAGRWADLQPQQSIHLSPSSSRASSLDAITRFVTSTLHLACIEVLESEDDIEVDAADGSEVIGAGHIQGDPSQILLVHVRWRSSPGPTTVTVKATDQQLVNSVHLYLGTLNT